MQLQFSLHTYSEKVDDIDFSRILLISTNVSGIEMWIDNHKL